MDKDINEYVKNEILLHSENGYVTKREGKTLEFKEKLMFRYHVNDKGRGNLSHFIGINNIL